MTDDEFMRNAIMPTYRHDYLGMLEDLKNAKSHFPGGYEFLRKCASIKVDKTVFEPYMYKPGCPCHDAAAYALQGLCLCGIDMCNGTSTTVEAKVEVDPKTKGLNWLWFEELSDFDHEKNGCSNEEALEILKGKGKDETEMREV